MLGIQEKATMLNFNDLQKTIYLFLNDFDKNNEHEKPIC